MINKNKKTAFTLVELLVVIAIIGILATLAVISLQNARSRARDAKKVADIRQIQTALELYYLDEGKYPSIEEITTMEEIFLEGSLYILDSEASIKTPDGVVFMPKIPQASKNISGKCLDFFETFKDHPEIGGENLKKALSNYTYTSLDNDYVLAFCLESSLGDFFGGLCFVNSEGRRSCAFEE